MDPTKEMGSGNCVWNPATNRSLAEEFLEWFAEDLEKANQPAQREAVPWIVMYASGFYCTTLLVFGLN